MYMCIFRQENLRILKESRIENKSQSDGLFSPPPTHTHNEQLKGEFRWLLCFYIRNSVKLHSCKTVLGAPSFPASLIHFTTSVPTHKTSSRPRLSCCPEIKENIFISITCLPSLFLDYKSAPACLAFDVGSGYSN